MKKFSRVFGVGFVLNLFVFVLLLAFTVGETTAVSEPTTLFPQNKTEIQAVEAITHTIFLPIVELTRQGHGILFFSNRAGTGKYDIYNMNLDGSNVRRLTYLDIDSYVGLSLPRWSPDGTQIAFEFEDVLYLMNEDGSHLEPLIDEPMTRVISFPAWSPDGTQIAYRAIDCTIQRPACIGPTGGGVRVVDVNTKEIKQVIPDGININILGNIIWTADGTSVWALPQESGYSGIGIGYLDNSPANWILTDYEIISFALSADENKIAFYTGLNSYVFDIDKNQIILSRLWDGVNDELRDQTWHPFKPQLAYVYENNGYAIDVYGFDGSSRTVLPFEALSGSVSLWGWTPDGSKILYDQFNRTERDVFMVDDDGNNLTNLTPDSSEIDDILADYRP